MASVMQKIAREKLRIPSSVELRQIDITRGENGHEPFGFDVVDETHEQKDYCMVVNVEPDGLGAAAGLLPSDIIVGVGQWGPSNKPCTGMPAESVMLMMKTAGCDVSLTVVERELLFPHLSSINTDLWTALGAQDVTASQLALTHGANPDWVQPHHNEHQDCHLINVVKNDFRQGIALLIATSCDVNKVNKLNWTPLIQAVLKGRYECAQILIAAGADITHMGVDINDKTKLKTPLQFALNVSNERMIRLLEGNGVGANGRNTYDTDDVADVDDDETVDAARFCLASSQSRWSKFVFSLKYTLYVHTAVGRWFHRKQITAWKLTDFKPHTKVPSSEFEDVTVHVLPLLTDNYCYLIVDPLTNDAVVIDPCVTEPVCDYVNTGNASGPYNLKAILSTHGHHDHAYANKELIEAYPGIKVFGTIEDKVPGVTDVLSMSIDTDFNVGGMTWKAIPFPGHTTGLVTFLLQPKLSRSFPLVFSGDGVFVAGTGRLFEGSANQMFYSLKRVADRTLFPDDALMFPGHEYALPNLIFTQKITRLTNDAVVTKLKQVVAAYQHHKSVIPTTFEEERQYNLFLRLQGNTDQEKIQHLSLLRQQKDAFAPTQVDFDAASAL